MSSPAAATSDRFVFEPYAPRVRVYAGGKLIADTQRAYVLRETRLEPVIYFPLEDIAMELMQRTTLVSFCPFRGNASYWTLVVGGQRYENVLWSYEHPIEAALDVRGYAAFYAGRMDHWLEDETEVPLATRDGVSGYSNPLLGHVLRDVPMAPDVSTLVHQLARACVAADMPLARLSLTLRTLHPQLVGRTFRWTRADDAIETAEASYAVLSEAAFTMSPLKLLFDGRGGVRRRLEGDDPLLDFGITRELHAQGMTDYVALPVAFNDGQVHGLSLTSDRPGGFSDVELGNFYEVLAVLGGLIEVHVLRHIATTLLGTYLGSGAGDQVLRGQIRRGAGMEIEAVVGFFDLRDSTALSSSMPRADYIGVLNEFFDAVAGAVLDHGGEVLRFMGDAVLATWPTDGAFDARAVCTSAMDAMVEASARVAALNERRVDKGRVPLGYGGGLHFGPVTYGNIGTPARLEFTVVGEAANAASRIEALCKPLGETRLVSGAVARHAPDRCRRVGVHALRGVAEPVEVFAL